MSKTVVITGASRGIGRATALEFAHKDINLPTNIVINCATNSKLLDEVKNELEQAGVNCLAMTGDISDYKFAEKFFSEIRERFETIDILVNNAGISMVGLFQDMSIDEWNRIMAVNTTSVFNCCHFAVPMMLSKKSGHIINVSSVWGNAGASCEVAYCATKGAVNSFTKALAKELAPSNIRVNAVALGAIDTEMNNHLDSDEKNALCEEIPMGRMGFAGEAAKLIADLSDSPAYLTGQIITMDGGWI